ncbi:2,3-bisphosphoglycerate-independent phosphoglycerate mutase [Sulfurospirillum diekertiae]|uniref:2,3-bisphosphoglycerate-independent phosphoglycerate mutase n=1 Tax=Sulfurospirillum diekertiae TaxID=1854492 RepID=A0A6G9VSU2_9BACT|nr:2,3-bisphosphoglycerate-independent phosphoglycerate mutase [Sulfurospirillum diekertiae]QIR75435.1 2,3-bisphosphoglycerate-independent phosphoglycerate mutase [Sulfurospirillum diekertiae]QIR78084.1 2,3-bisphosphoglycerate-independent phosphoglycerate mutase [Sulfurospirillum diekertiae]
MILKPNVTKTLLIITDGIGHNVSQTANAFAMAHKPTYDKLFSEVPYTLIATSGLSVGLPEGQMGNSEVGHMCIGSGRILYQNLVKISLAAKDGSLATNPALTQLLHVKGAIHIIGLVSDGGVHSHIEHIIDLAKIVEAQGKKVYLHVITDGRDVSPTSGMSFLEQLLAICNENISIASISGRFFSMDRDNRWERVKEGYRVMVDAKPKEALHVKEYLQSMYDKGVTDEFVEPMAFEPYAGMHADDGVIFANFRNDRMRELSRAIGFKEFGEFSRTLNGVECITMTEYDSSYPFPIMFQADAPQNTLCDVISRSGFTQFHTAETEKYAHVTFFFNGGIEEPKVGETRLLVPSPKVKTYDLQPQMSAPEVGDVVLTAMNEQYDFIVVNFANGDMVGHTGSLEAAIQAVEAVDVQLGRLFDKAKELGYAVVLTSDHGNCEQMFDAKGAKLTNHTTFEVYGFVMDERVQHVQKGGLNNIAPTILKLMGLEIPSEMDQPLVVF